MNNYCKILILTAGYGAGHISVANAIKEHIHNNKEQEIEIIDLYEVMHPILYKSLYKSYELLIRFFPFLYNKYYYSKEKNEVIQRLDTTSRYSIKLLSKLIKEKKPQIIISTFPSCTGYAAKFKRKYNCDIPLITCITDIVANYEWLYKENNLYFIANEDVKKALINKGIEKEKLVVTGIPVRKKFLDLQDKDYLKRQLGYLPEDKVILMMGGGFGLLPKNKSFYNWLNSLEGVKIVVLTSKNKKLYKMLLKMNCSNIRIFEYCNNVYQYMRIADVFIGKSGGITLFEAIASKMPVIIYKPILGQEIENSKYIINNNIGYIAKNLKQLNHLIIKSLQIKERDKLIRNIEKIREHINMEAIGSEIIKRYHTK